MKVALVISSLHSNQGIRGGGMERSAVNLANELAGRGCGVSVITLDRDTGAPLYPLNPAIALIRLGLDAPAANKLEAAASMLRSSLAIGRAVRKNGADVAVAFGNHTCVLTLAGCLCFRIPVVVAERTHPGYFPIGRGWGPLRRWLYPRAARIVAQTGEIARWYRQNLGCADVEVIPNHVSPPSESPPPSKSRNIVAGAGMLAPVKGFDQLIRAFAGAARLHPDWDLVIYGEGPDRESLLRRAEEQSLAGRVFLPGRMDDLGPHLAKADIFALSSRTEGFPNVLCEAMACGLPAVAFDCPSGPADIVRDGVDGRLVPAGDVDGMADALGELMENAALRKAMGRKAREVVDRFSARTVTDSWMNMLQSIADKAE